MKIRNSVLLAVLGTTALMCCGGHPAAHRIQNGIQLNTRTCVVRVQFYSDSVVRVLKQPPNAPDARKSLVVVQDLRPGLKLRIREKRNTVSVESEKLILSVSRHDGRIEYASIGGPILLKEKGAAVFSHVEVPCEQRAFSVQQKFRLDRNEGIYGLGQHQTGFMNYRGRTVKLVQTNTDAVIPFWISTRSYGVLWDNCSKTVFNDGAGETSLWSEVADGVDYVFIKGSNMDGVIAGYRALTGQAPLYGKWAYGYWQSKEHYHTRDELLAVAVKYRRKAIPIDNLVQDWDYWNGAKNWGGMFFDPVLFPSPKDMVDRLHAMHYHLMISVWPAMGPNTVLYRDMSKNGYLYAPVGWAGFKYYDAFNPSANQLYWRYLKNGLLSKGIDAWWIDSTEPDVVNALTKESTEYEMKKVGRNHLGSWARTLNAYSLVMTDALYKNLRRETGRKRAFILTRSTFAGQQRNAATTWSGDIGASWDVYRRQISAGLNHCMAGVPYWTFDIGAFVIGAYGGLFHRGGKDPAYQELYTRMFQFGTFCPIFRSHGSETPREIWEFGDFAPVLVKFDCLRYRLLPYIYSLAWQVTKNGYTIMRGLPMDFPEDENVRSIDDQFLFGPAMMVCPVTQYMLHRPPEPSVPIRHEFFRTPEAKPGLRVRYYKDAAYQILGREAVEPNVDIFWYEGRPAFVTDSAFSIRWEGKLVPRETGPHQFHLKSFDAKRIKLDGKILPMVYTSVEQYTDVVELTAGRAYDFVLETENRSTGAARMQLFWKTPSLFAKEKILEKREAVRSVTLPTGSNWTDFWTGKSFDGGQSIKADAPIEQIPILVRAGSILPLGPFVQYADEKPPDPVELRIYPGADGRFDLYEDENDGYGYEQGVYSTIGFQWNDADRRLTIENRRGAFPGMLDKRIFDIVVVGEGRGTGLDVSPHSDSSVVYKGRRQVIQL